MKHDEEQGRRQPRPQHQREQQQQQQQQRPQGHDAQQEAEAEEARRAMEATLVRIYQREFCPGFPPQFAWPRHDDPAAWGEAAAARARRPPSRGQPQPSRADEVRARGSPPGGVPNGLDDEAITYLTSLTFSPHTLL